MNTSDLISARHNAVPYVAIGPDELAEPAEAVDCTRCGEQHVIEYGTSRTLLADNTWSEPVPSKKLGFYKCGGELYLGTVEGRRWK